MLGQTSYLLDGTFCPHAAVDFMSTHGITHLAAAPTFYRALRAAGVTVPASIRMQAHTYRVVISNVKVKI